MTSAQLFMLTSMLNLGEFHKVSSRLPALMAAASEHGNLYATTEVYRTRFNFLWLVADDPESARRELAEALQLWSHHGFHRQHYNALRSKINTELYTGEAEAAWGHVLISEWDALRGSLTAQNSSLPDSSAPHASQKRAGDYGTVSRQGPPFSQGSAAARPSD